MVTDHAVRGGRRGWQVSEERIDPGSFVILATVTGTNGRDFIHRAGDGLVAPPGYTDIAQATTGDDVIDGGKGKDIIYADDGTNYITGGGGTDILYGGAGFDHFMLNAASDIDGRAEYIDGGASNNFLSFMFGGTVDITAATLIGINVWYLRPELALTVRLTGEQFDEVTSGFGGGSATRLELTSAADYHYNQRYITELQSIRGSFDADVIDMRGKNINIHALPMTISGEGGNDEISVRTSAQDSGHVKSFVLDGGEGDDSLTLGAGIGTLTGDAGDDHITGGKQSDAIDGGADQDVLRGGGASDSLTGGAGADIFAYADPKDSNATSGIDTITDFSHADGDRIDLSKIDADTTQSGDQAFTLVAGGAFTDHAGELIQTSDGHGNTLVQGDVDGDGIADLAISFAHAPVLVGPDFAL